MIVRLVVLIFAVCSGHLALAADPAVKAAAAAQRALVKVVRTYDLDGNRTLDANELQELNRVYAGAPDGPLAVLDADRDGDISVAEIAAVNKRLARPPSRKATPASARAASSPVPEAPPEQEGTGTARLSWQPPTQNADGTPLKNLSGYVIRYGRSPKALNRRIQLEDPKLTTYTVEKLGEGTWYFSVAAVTQGGAESVAGPVVSKTIAASDKVP